MFIQTGDGLALPRQGKYTFKDINATSGSRNIINTNLRKGHVVQLDPNNHEGYGVPFTFGRPTNAAVFPLMLVDNFGGDINELSATATLRKGGQIYGITAGIGYALVNASGALAIGQRLVVDVGTTDHGRLIDAALGVATAAALGANLQQMVDTTATEGVPIAVLLEAISGSGEFLRRVAFGMGIGQPAVF